MTSSILEMLGRGSQTTPVPSDRQGILNLYRTVMNSGNPWPIVNSMLNQKTPIMQQINMLIQQNGGDAQRAFYTLCNQLGVSSDQVLSMLR